MTFRTDATLMPRRFVVLLIAFTCAMLPDGAIELEFSLLCWGCAFHVFKVRAVDAITVSEKVVILFPLLNKCILLKV